MINRRAVMLHGSPKPIERSASGRLGRLLAEPLESEGWTITWIHLPAAVRSGEERTRLFESVDAAALVVLAAPLYVDSLPAQAIEALEFLAGHRRAMSAEQSPNFATLLNCGFAEPNHNATCQQICRAFAQEAGFQWMGELSFGAAGHVNRRVKRILRVAGDALSIGVPIPLHAMRSARRPIIPRLVYILGGNTMWRRSAKQAHGLEVAELLARPYTDEDGSG